jgi:hypothetical protein
MTAQLTAQTKFTGTCPGCGSARTYTPLVPRGRSRAYAPRSPYVNVRCGECGTAVRLTAEGFTPCDHCWINYQLKPSAFWAARGLDWPVKQVGPMTVHLACASGIEAHAHDIEHERVRVDEEGIARWISNGHAVPRESALILHGLGLALDIGATKAAEEAETREFLAAYRERMAGHVPDAEELAEMRAAFGPGATVVNVITGQETQL